LAWPDLRLNVECGRFGGRAELDIRNDLHRDARTEIRHRWNSTQPSGRGHQGAQCVPVGKAKPYVIQER
jgi:hypothetical protein